MRPQFHITHEQIPLFIIISQSVNHHLRYLCIPEMSYKSQHIVVLNTAKCGSMSESDAIKINNDLI